MKLETADGLTRITLRQSTINEYLLCPERARLLWHGIVEDHDTAESAIGTAVHVAIERFLAGDPPGDALEAATERFRGLSEAPEFRWPKIKTVETALRHIETCFNAWLTDIEPRLGYPWAIEHRFELKFSEEETDLGPVEIWLAGTIDFMDETGIWDWKTCTRITKYTTDGWQLDRWAVQPTVYTWAATQLGYYNEWGSIPFAYGAMQRTPACTAIRTVERGPDHWRWLEDICWNIAWMILAVSRQWPVNDQHALCSEAWCPAWTLCKGKYTQSAEPQVTGLAA